MDFLQAGDLYYLFHLWKYFLLKGIQSLIKTGLERFFDTYYATNFSFELVHFLPHKKNRLRKRESFYFLHWHLIC